MKKKLLLFKKLLINIQGTYNKKKSIINKKKSFYNRINLFIGNE